MRFIGTLIVICTIVVPALSAGTLVTKEGKTIEGDISINDSGALLVTPGAITLELADVKRVSFGQEAAGFHGGEFKHQDIGKVHVAGSAEELKSERGSTYRLSGSGFGFWGPKDSGQVLAWPFEGDGQIIAHVDAKGDERTGVVAGVMFRDSFDESAPMAATLVFPSGEVRFPRRPLKEWISGPEGRTAAVKEQWVRLARNGDEVTSYKSKDGKYWSAVGHQAMPLAKKGLVCLVTATMANAYAGSAVFDQVKVIPGPSGAAYFEHGTGPISGVVMTDGTMLAGWVETVENGKVTFVPHFARDGSEIIAADKANDGRRLMKFPIEAVSRVRMNPEPPDVEKIIGSASSGVLLASGDFIEADVQRFIYRRYLDINSVLFGAKRFDAVSECLSFVLHEGKPVKGAYEVSVRDGSVIQASGVKLAKGWVEVESGSAGKMKFPVGEVKSIEVN